MTGGRAAAVQRLRPFVPWLLMIVIGGPIAYMMVRHLNRVRAGENVEWRHAKALALLGGAAIVAVVTFHLNRRRWAAMGFSQTDLVRARGLLAWVSDLPAVLRVLGIAALAIALARPETYRNVKHEEDSVDIMIVFDMSKSMQMTDLRRDRMDAAQRVVRRFLRGTTGDRVGLVVFGREAMLRCPLTQDAKLLERIVSTLEIGEVPAFGTAIGDGLALALAQLRRSDGECDPSPGAQTTCAERFVCSKEGRCEGKKSKVVILLSDGDSNWATQFEPEEAAQAAAAMKVKVYTVLVGGEDSELFETNPDALRSIAQVTGGEFFRATDYESFDQGFHAVRKKLDKQKRVRIERLADEQLFLPFAVLAAILCGLDLLLSHTRLRRLP